MSGEKQACQYCNTLTGAEAERDRLRAEVERLQEQAARDARSIEATYTFQKRQRAAYDELKRALEYLATHPCEPGGTNPMVHVTSYIGPVLARAEAILKGEK